VENAMLRITVHHDGGRYRLELAGKLGGPWVAETENVWRFGPSSGKEIELDMREVTGIDNAGRELLIAMHKAGARFVVQGVAMTALIEEITGKQPLDGAKRRRTKNQDQHSQIRRDTK
jgi:hypothetical protein